MIETETLIRWTCELVAFVNGDVDPLYDISDIDPKDHRLPDEPRTAAQIDALRETASKALNALLAESKRKKGRAKLLRRAARWLDDPLVRSTHDAYNLTPMDGRLSLDEDGRLQVAPRFRSDDAKYAVTFAELIREDSPAIIKRCWCKKFLVRRADARGQPRKLCREHYEQSKQSKKRTTKK